jgi:ankyrin repeat protein
MASERGLKDIVQCLVDHHADPNAKDSYGRTAIHTAISNHHPDCAQVLLQQPSLDLSIRDKSNQTPFAAALSAKDNETGCAILKREPKAAEQMDSRGQNFLHLAVLNQDVESVIFLLSVAVDVNSKVQNPTMNTPLHYAVKGGAEIILRHLLLAMGDVHAVDNHNRGVLHLAVEGNFSTILSILLEHGANPDHVDEEGNNALHIAMQLGHEDCIRILLNDSDINLTTVNMRYDCTIVGMFKFTSTIRSQIRLC